MGASTVFVVATLVRVFDATSASHTSAGMVLVMAASLLLLTSVWGLHDTARARWPALLAGVASFLALAFVGDGAGSTASVPYSAISAVMPMAILVTATVAATQAGASLARRAACRCG